MNHEQGMHSIAQEYLRVTYLKPLRDAENELKPGYRSRVARVIEGLEAFRSDEKKDEVIQDFEEAFKALNNELQALLQKIHTFKKVIIQNGTLEKYRFRINHLLFKKYYVV